MNEIASRNRAELNNNMNDGLKSQNFHDKPGYTSSTSCSDISEDLDGPCVQDVLAELKDHQDDTTEEQPDVRRFRSMSDGAPVSPNDNGDAFEIFPSLPNSVLRKMGLFGDDPRERFSDEEVEQKFVSLSLAFTIDAATIKDRCERQRRYRDQTETNINKEIERLIEKVHRLQPLCVDAETTELLTALLSQVDIIIRATALAAISAERFGAVQHEERLAESVQLMISHVNVLKQQRDSARKQLQYTKRVLQDTNSTEAHPVRQRPAHLNNRAITRRRASIATISQQNQENTIRPLLGDSRRMARRTSELSLRGSVLTRTARSSRLELGVDLVEIREGAVENIPSVVDEENDEEVEVEEPHSCHSTDECSEVNSCTDSNSLIQSSQIHEIDVSNLPLKDKLIHRVKQYGYYAETAVRNWANNASSNEVFCFCALMCFSLSIITMGNILVELEYSKPGGVFYFWNFSNLWTEPSSTEYTKSVTT